MMTAIVTVKMEINTYCNILSFNFCAGGTNNEIIVINRTRGLYIVYTVSQNLYCITELATHILDCYVTDVAFSVD